MALLMILSPASAAVVHPTVLVPAYKNTVSQPNSYMDTSGCAKIKTGNPTWAPATGVITGSAGASAKTCAKSLGYVGGNSYASGSPTMEVAFPLKVASNGNHAIGTSITVKIAASSSFTYSSTNCKFNVHYPPATGSYYYAYCESGADISLYVSASVMDLNNASWHSNYSYADAYNDSYFENYTDCYNYAGTPTCYNFTGTNSYANAYSYNAAGFSTFAWNGVTSVSMWTNGTNMIKSHHYVLVLSVGVSASAFAEKANIIGAWSGSGVALVNMATLGNGAKVTSIVIS